MTRDEAAKELGLGPTAGPAEVREAYLHLLKARNPETDPDGFQRLRSAYELLRARPSAAVALRLLPIVVPPDPTIRETASAAPAPRMRPIMMPAGDTRPPAIQPATESAKAAADREQVLIRSPESLPIEAIEEAERSAGAVLLSAVAAGLAERGNVRLGIRVARRSLEVASRPGGEPPVFENLLRVLLWGHQRGAVEESIALCRRLAAFADERLDDARTTPLELRARWVLVQELSAVPPWFPLRLRAIITGAVRENDLARAKDELRVYVRMQGEFADEALVTLGEAAPNLHRMVKELLATPPPAPTPPVPPPSAKSGKWGEWALMAFSRAYLGLMFVALFIVLFKMATSPDFWRRHRQNYDPPTPSHEREPDPSPPPRAAVPLPAAPVQDATPAHQPWCDPARAGRLGPTIDALCEASVQPGSESACPLARRLHVAIAERDCDGAESALDSLRVAVANLPDEGADADAEPAAEVPGTAIGDGSLGQRIARSTRPVAAVMQELEAALLVDQGNQDGGRQ
ncbi:MAG: J domain-containing protein [Deltaproteobacteria bacterium]|nr:J domain-containing protein [Deltaproteobacteria bacterium]